VNRRLKQLVVALCDRPMFCITANEKVYFTASGCEFGLGGRKGLKPDPGGINTMEPVAVGGQCGPKTAQGKTDDRWWSYPIDENRPEMDIHYNEGSNPQESPEENSQ